MVRRKRAGSPEIVEEKKVDELVVALETVDNNRLMDILYSLYCYKRPIKILADKSSSLSQVKIKAIKGVPLVDVTDNNFLPIEQNVKLFMDKTLSLVPVYRLAGEAGFPRPGVFQSGTDRIHGRAFHDL